MTDPTDPGSRMTVPRRTTSAGVPLETGYRQLSQVVLDEPRDAVTGLTEGLGPVADCPTASISGPIVAVHRDSGLVTRCPSHDQWFTLNSINEASDTLVENTRLQLHLSVDTGDQVVSVFVPSPLTEELAVTSVDGAITRAADTSPAAVTNKLQSDLLGTYVSVSGPVQDSILVADTAEQITPTTIEGPSILESGDCLPAACDGSPAPAHRVLPSELQAASRTAPDAYADFRRERIVLPTGRLVSRVFLVGEVTSLQGVGGPDSDFWVGDIRAGTDSIPFKAGEYSPEAAAHLDKLAGSDTPVAILGHVRLPEDPDGVPPHTPYIRPESIEYVSDATATIWLAEAATHTLARIDAIDAAADACLSDATSRVHAAVESDSPPEGLPVALSVAHNQYWSDLPGLLDTVEAATRKTVSQHELAGLVPGA